jgi:hypothetical protein
MASIPQLERAFSIQPHNAGAPGIRYRHPNVKIGSETADQLALDVIRAVDSASDAIWAVLHEEGVLKAVAKLVHASLTDIVDAGADDERESAAKSLAAWPRHDDGTPSFEQHERPEFINVMGYSLRDEKPQAERPVKGRRQAVVTR